MDIISHKTVSTLIPDIAPSSITLVRPSVGQSPAGFKRIHVEMLPAEVGRFVGYDPRTMIQRPSRGGKTKADTTPHNVDPQIVRLQNQVQRSIDHDRVKAMTEYLAAAFLEGTFADWGPIELVTADEPDLSEYESRHLVHVPSNISVFCADGQHRYCAVLDFVHKYPEYADRFTQALTISIMPEGKLIEWAGQKFHDHNFFSVAVRKGKALAVDTRDPLNALVHRLHELPAIKTCGGIAQDRDTLLKNDTRLTTHTVLHRFVRGFFGGRPGLDKTTENMAVDEGMAQSLADYITTLSKVLPWTSKEREEYLTRASVVFAALSVIGHDLFSGDYSALDIAKRMDKLRDLDWRRTNLEWEGIIGRRKEGKLDETTGVTSPDTIQPESARPAIDSTIRFFREVLDVKSTRK